MLLIVARTFDKKTFENESVFPAIERSAALMQRAFASTAETASTFTSVYFAAQWGQ